MKLVLWLPFAHICYKYSETDDFKLIKFINYYRKIFEKRNKDQIPEFPMSTYDEF